MVRTADSGVRVGGKTTGKTVRSTPSTSSRNRSPSNTAPEKGFNSYNNVCPRETPSWQKPITSFFSNITKTTATCVQENCNIENITESAYQLELNGNTDKAMDDHEKENDIPNRIEEACSSSSNVQGITRRISERDDQDEMLPRKKIKFNMRDYNNFEMCE